MNFRQKLFALSIVVVHLVYNLVQSLLQFFYVLLADVLLLGYRHDAILPHQEVVASWVLSDLYVNFTFRTFGVELFELIVHDGFGTLQDVKLAFSGREENLLIILAGL